MRTRDLAWSLGYVITAAFAANAGCNSGDGDSAQDSGSIRTDGGMPSDSGVRPDTGPARDSGPRDSGPRPDAGPAEALVMALHMQRNTGVGQLCTCAFEALGYATTDDCELGNVNSAAYGNCQAMAAAEYAAELGELWSCELEAAEGLVTCMMGVTGCDADATAACSEEWNAANEDCPAPDETAYAEFFADTNACLIGDETACPDGMATGTTGAAVFTGTTIGGGHGFSPSCDDAYGLEAEAADRAYLWTPPAAGTYVVDTRGSSFDTLIYVLAAGSVGDGGPGLCGGMELECNDDIGDEPYVLASELTVTLTADQSIVIVVDAWVERQAGDFVININPMMPAPDAGPGAPDAG